MSQPDAMGESASEPQDDVRQAVAPDWRLPLRPVRRQSSSQDPNIGGTCSSMEILTR